MGCKRLIAGETLDSPDGTLATVCRKDDEGRNCRLERPVQVGEALDVQHVDLVYEEDAGHELCRPLVDELVNGLVDFLSQLICDMAKKQTRVYGRWVNLPFILYNTCSNQVAKFDTCNSLLSSVHILLINIMQCVRLYIKRK